MLIRLKAHKILLHSHHQVGHLLHLERKLEQDLLKRLQSITLLSGGEQALTALSLIFAVFLTSPAPICILDEVDAPLDDANVTRFCSLLDELTKITETKFIIITHHALTMSRVDRLYGVTMPEKGVSQLVSVDLQKAEELVA